MNIYKIGDPHLGRKFRTGVPLHRRGERERKQLENFKQHLYVPCDVNCMVGDLFDEPEQPLSLIFEVASIYEAAARENPHILYVLLAGNHDLAREFDKKGAFHLLKLCLSRIDNIMVLTKPAVMDGVAYFPWEWDRTAIQQLGDIQSAKVAIGHWDLKDFGGDVSHLCPVKELKAMGIEEIYSGHYHVAGEYILDDIVVNCTGSMEPFSHAEDPSGDLYVTMSLTELESVRPEVIRDKNVRVILAPGEKLPTGLDCLSLTSKRIGEPETLDYHEVTVGNFNLMVTLRQKLVEHDVPEDVASYIEGKANAIR